MVEEIRDHYLDEFAKFLVKKWQVSFDHSFQITKSSFWKAWPEPSWYCNSLEQANANYCWGGKDQDDKAASYKRDLVNQLDQKDDISVADTCIKIFKWGGVSRKNGDKSRVWVEDNKASKSLCRKIILAIKLLQPHSHEELADFNPNELLMNSSMTKVYAFGDKSENIAMYDGRVGAALGLLVRDYLTEINEKTIPVSLSFRWGDPSTENAKKEKTRDPSNEIYNFEKLPNESSNKASNLIRAKLSRNTNTLINKVLFLLQASGDQKASALDIERALFMIGYDVRRRQSYFT